MKKVKITVLKTEFYPELADRYLTEGREAGPCPFQTFPCQSCFVRNPDGVPKKEVKRKPR